MNELPRYQDFQRIKVPSAYVGLAPPVARNYLDFYLSSLPLPRPEKRFAKLFSSLSPARRTLLQNLLKMDPQQRCSAKAAMELPYFSEPPLPTLKCVAGWRRLACPFPPPLPAYSVFAEAKREYSERQPMEEGTKTASETRGLAFMGPKCSLPVLAPLGAATHASGGRPVAAAAAGPRAGAPPPPPGNARRGPDATDAGPLAKQRPR